MSNPKPSLLSLRPSSTSRAINTSKRPIRSPWPEDDDGQAVADSAPVAMLPQTFEVVSFATPPTVHSWRLKVIRYKPTRKKCPNAFEALMAA